MFVSSRQKCLTVKMWGQFGSVGTGIALALYLLSTGLSQGCWARRTEPRPRWGDKKKVEKVEEVVESVAEVTEPGEILDKKDDLVSSLPEDLQNLGKLLAEVAGEEYSDFFDPKWDQVWPNSTLSGPVSLGLTDDDRDKRFSPALLSAALPIFSQFAGGLLKPMLQQLMY